MTFRSGEQKWKPCATTATDELLYNIGKLLSYSFDLEKVEWEREKNYLYVVYWVPFLLDFTIKKKYIHAHSAAAILDSSLCLSHSLSIEHFTRKRIKMCNYYCLKILCFFKCNISFMIRFFIYNNILYTLHINA